MFFTLGMWMFFNSNGEVYENACDLPPAAETVEAVPRAVDEESRDVFNSNGEVYENAWDLPPAAETVVAVTRAVEEESRDVRAGVLRYLIS